MMYRLTKTADGWAAKTFDFDEEDDVDDLKTLVEGCMPTMISSELEDAADSLNIDVEEIIVID